VDSFLDIYSKLLIALISFTAPLITLILSIPGQDLTKFKQRQYEELKQSVSLLNIDTDKFKSSQSVTTLIDSSFKGLKMQAEKIEKTLQLLNPKKQIVKIFTSLGVSLLFLIAYKFNPDKLLNICSHYIAITLIILSLLSFVYTIYSFKAVAWMAIDAKQSIALEQSSIDIDTQPENGI
jgi:hypothetical protein